VQDLPWRKLKPTDDTPAAATPATPKTK